MRGHVLAREEWVAGIPEDATATNLVRHVAVLARLHRTSQASAKSAIGKLNTGGGKRAVFPLAVGSLLREHLRRQLRWMLGIERIQVVLPGRVLGEHRIGNIVARTTEFTLGVERTGDQPHWFAPE